MQIVSTARRLSFVLALIVAALGLAPSEVSAQAAGRPRVYLDCQSGGCDFNYFRTEIDWITWVRDQNDAHVHIIMTRQNTGAGGQEYVMDFIGRAPYQSYVQQSLYRTLPTDTQREELDGVALMLSVGIAHFATQSGFRNLVQLDGVSAEESGGPPRQGIISQEEANDPWNLWVFRLNGNGNFDSETSERTWRINGSFDATRVSPTWKQNYRVNYNKSSQRRQLTSGEFVDERYDWGVNWRTSYALAQHFSIGVSGNVGRNTRNNQRVWGQFNPALEYSFFPYEEATRRSLTAFYEIGPVYRNYFETTLFGKDAELRAEQALSLAFEQRQPWGSAFVQIRGSTYLHDLATNNVSLNGNLSFRIVRGLDLNMGASYSRVRDQISLSGEDLTDEERLLELSQHKTDYQAQLRFGFSYQFGSIYNNVVNNRF
jgi:hypothetical protein